MVRHLAHLTFSALLPAVLLFQLLPAALQLQVEAAALAICYGLRLQKLHGLPKCSAFVGSKGSAIARRGVGLCAAGAAAPSAPAELGQLCQTFHSLPTAAVAPASSAAA